jgi:hypothetical protein
MRQEADGLSAFARKAGQIHRIQPVFGSVAPMLSIKRSILRIAERALDKETYPIYYSRRENSIVLRLASLPLGQVSDKV